MAWFILIVVFCFEFKGFFIYLGIIFLLAIPVGIKAANDAEKKHKLERDKIYEDWKKMMEDKKQKENKQ